VDPGAERTARSPGLRTGGDDCLLKADRSITIAPDLNDVRRSEPAIESLQGVRCLRRAARLDQSRPLGQEAERRGRMEDDGIVQDYA